MSSKIKAHLTIQVHYKTDCTSLTLQGEKTLIAADTIVTLPTRSDARRRTDEKFAPFASETQTLLAPHAPLSALPAVHCSP